MDPGFRLVIGFIELEVTTTLSLIRILCSTLQNMQSLLSLLGFQQSLSDYCSQCRRSLRLRVHGFTSSPAVVSLQRPSRTNCHSVVKVKVILRPTVSRPVRLRHPSGTSDQFFFLLEIFFRQLAIL
jgi:hypothetical protein